MTWEYPKMVHNKLTKWNWMVAEPWNLVLGKDTDIGAFTYIQAGGGVVIQQGVKIGGGCFIYSISTIDGTEGMVTIEKGAKVGAQTTIFPGVTIGEGATVGAHSLVKTDIPPSETWGGVPAKKIK